MKLKQLSVIEPSSSFTSIKIRVDTISGRCGFVYFPRSYYLWFDIFNTDFSRELFVSVHSALSEAPREIK